MRTVLLFAAACVGALLVVGSADANNIATLYWHKTSDEGIVGVRSAIGNPGGSQINISYQDAFFSAVEANNGNCETSETNCAGLEQGIAYTDAVAVDPNGDCQNYTNNFFYFVEKDYHGTYTCSYEGAAGTTESHNEKAQQDSSNVWWGYLDGVQQSTLTHNSWTDCNHNACGIRALGEEGTTKAGDWQAKFSNYSSDHSKDRWQFQNSCCWNTITNYSQSYDPNLWTLNVNNFPDGLWTFIYHK